MWTRAHYQPTTQRPYVCFVVPGADISRFAPTRSAHRLDAEPPQGLELFAHTRAEDPQLWSQFTSGPGWEALQASNPPLAWLIEQQTAWAVLRGHIVHDSSLDYLRNTIGLVTALLDARGVAVFDPFSLIWRNAATWRDQVFSPGTPQIWQHVITWLSPTDKGRGWLHTRGMGTFGRPDLSVRNVHPKQHRATLAAVEHLVEWQAAGGVIPDGQVLHIQGLRHDLICTYVDSTNDPAFNNCHIEMEFVSPRKTSGSSKKTIPTRPATADTAAADSPNSPTQQPA